MNKTTRQIALLLAISSTALGMAGCKRSEPEKIAAPTQQTPAAQTIPAPGTQAPAAPSAEIPADVASAPAAEEQNAASPAGGKPVATTGASKGAATSRGKQPPVLRAVRHATQPGFDRLVFDFGKGGLPGWRASYVDAPVLGCGTGEPVRVAGAAFLQISFSPAQAHTGQGKSTSASRRQKLSLQVARELVQTCDFEGEVTYVIGLARPNAYTPRPMSDPSRLAIDIAH